MKTFCIRFSLEGRDRDEFSDFLWQIPGVLGLQECGDAEGGFFRPEADFEIMEFGSAAAERCAEWLERENARPDGAVFMEVHLEAESFGPPEVAALSEKIKAAGLGVTVGTVTELEAVDYLQAYQKSVRGQSVGQNLWVGPPWDETAPLGKTILFVEPALAFGTGEHPTTQLCLERLEEMATEKAPGRILDLGTGSGVLAAACRIFFPAATITALDLDPLCEESFRKTFALNHLSIAGIQLGFGPAGDLAQWRDAAPFNLIVSNIYAEVLAQLLPQVKRLLAPGGKWILSGVLAGPSEKILENALAADFLCKIRRSRERMPAADLADRETWIFMELEKKA